MTEEDKKAINDAINEACCDLGIDRNEAVVCIDMSDDHEPIISADEGYLD